MLALSTSRNKGRRNPPSCSKYIYYTEMSSEYRLGSKPDIVWITTYHYLRTVLLQLNQGDACPKEAGLGDG